MVFEVTLIFKDGKYDEHLYKIADLEDMGMGSSNPNLVTIKYIEDGFEDKIRYASYNFDEIFSMVVEEV